MDFSVVFLNQCVYILVEFYSFCEDFWKWLNVILQKFCKKNVFLHFSFSYYSLYTDLKT